MLSLRSDSFASCTLAPEPERFVASRESLLGVSAYAYLRDRISRRFELPSLATSIEAAANTTANGLASRC